jgi:UDP-N-acetylmuramate dehydrogenase
MTLDIRRRVALDAMNTLAVPAVAEHFAELSDPDQLEALLAEVQSNNWPLTVLGSGSNVVLGDTLPGLTLHQACRGIRVIEEGADSVCLEVAAGENWHEFVSWCLERDYFGLENLALIPGTVGAAPIQNVGAYGVEVGKFISSVQCCSLPGGERFVLDREGCEFDYRNSIFKRLWRDRALIESVTFRLARSPDPVATYHTLARWLEEHDCVDPTPRQVFDAVVAIRSTRLPDPAAIPNVGSFFKNPRVSARALTALQEQYPELPHFFDERGGHKLPAAWLIEQCGFKTRGGPVRVHAEHALVIVNPERRPAREIAALADDIAAAVEEQFAILLEQEPRSYGAEAADRG